MLQPGQKLDNYEILDRLGEGGFGRVWLAGDLTVVGRKVAIKELADPTPESLERFLVEMQILAGINHPGIVTFHQTIDQGRYLVMEYIQEGSLRQKIGTQKPLALNAATNIIISLCNVLEAVHAQNVIHHDLKPDNLFLTANGVKVGDFGIAEVSESGRDSQRIGTLPYMPPECFGKMHGANDHRGDLYAVGVILFELLTGVRPFQASDPKALIYEICFEQPAIPLTTPKWVQGILQKALAKSTALRFQSAAEMRTAIESQATPQIFPAALIKASRANVQAERLLGRWKISAAISQAEQGLRVYSDHPRLLFTLARCRLILRQAAEALPLLIRSRQLDPGIQCERELGYAFVQMGESGKAIGCLTEYVKRRPDDLKGFALLMEALYHTGDYRQIAEIAGALRDEDPLFLNNYYLANILDQKSTAAIKAFKTAAKHLKRIPHYLAYNLRIVDHHEMLGQDRPGPHALGQHETQRYHRLGDVLYFATFAATLVPGTGKRVNIPPLRIDIETPDTAPRSHDFDGGFVSVGRARGQDIEIDSDPNVSRYHGVFYYRDLRYYYRDLNSTQGSYLGDQSVGLDVPLVGMQAIRIGVTQLRISY